jgi:Ca-activated chloride channel family protein
MNSRIAVFLILIGLVYAQAPHLLIMDSTGSMDESLPNSSQTKMEAAKIAAADFVDSTGGEIGMMVFADCDSGGDYTRGGIQVVENFTTNKASLKEKISKLTPEGNTAIAKALQEGSDYLTVTRGKGTIIIITDGEETCGGDPVELAGQIYQNGTGRIHVIGFLLGDSAEKKARAIAVAGGGNYYGANDVGSLTSALGQITAENPLPPCCPAFVLPGLVALGAFCFRRAG